MMWDSWAQAVISLRLRAPSLFWIAARWPFTVLTDMKRAAAISWVVRPRATARITSVSRSVSGGVGLKSGGGFDGGEVAKQARGDRRGYQCVADAGGPHGGGEQRGVAVFEDESEGSGLEGTVDVFVEPEGGDDDDPERVGDARAGECAGDVDAVEAGHADSTTELYHA